jgi:hypothetical protein
MVQLQPIPPLKVDATTQVEAVAPPPVAPPTGLPPRAPVGPPPGTPPLSGRAGIMRLAPMAQRPARAEMGVGTEAPARGEMEVQTEPETIRLGGKKGQEMEVERLRERISTGVETLSLRPARYLTRAFTPKAVRAAAARDTLAALPKPEDMAALPRPEDVGAAAGGGGGPRSVSTAVSDPRMSVVAAPTPSKILNSPTAMLQYLRSNLGSKTVYGADMKTFASELRKGRTPEEAVAAVKANPARPKAVRVYDDPAEAAVARAATEAAAMEAVGGGAAGGGAAGGGGHPFFARPSGGAGGVEEALAKVVKKK